MISSLKAAKCIFRSAGPGRLKTDPSKRERRCLLVSASSLAFESETKMTTVGGENYPHGLETLSPESTIQHHLQRLGKLEEVPLINGESRFVRPTSLLYELDGKQRRWDAVESHSSVGVVIYNTDKRSFVLVRQFRPPVYASLCRAAAGAPVDHSEGFTYELCAGILDKDLTLEEITSEEIQEETGYKVLPKDIKALGPAIASAGTSGAKHYMFYAEVNDSMRVSLGGGLGAGHGELIEVLSLPLEHAEAFIADPSLNKSPGLLYGVLWGFHAVKSGKLGGGTDNPLLNEALGLKPVLPV